MIIYDNWLCLTTYKNLLYYLMSNISLSDSVCTRAKKIDTCHVCTGAKKANKVCTRVKMIDVFQICTCNIHTIPLKGQQLSTNN